MDTQTTAKSPYYTALHEAFRDTMRRFVGREIAPFVDEWDEAGSFPRVLYRKAAGVSLLLIEKGIPGFSQTPLKKMAGGPRTPRRSISTTAGCRRRT